ncbi:PD-(D/E)XK nuclease superfamily protein [Chlorogloeopsis fritschii]|uniref:PD-(D/E)XK nuclease superfamily protein n=1 Tax=Chlorogloeopsis fritschii TaxID=1124 RepID=UPI0023F4CEE3|nr:PD-(D/E)XK nuclease superfamily protein [Chlorogloeopsis fritschii]
MAAKGIQMIRTQGARANKSGEILENHVETTLRAHGYFQVCSHVPKKQRREFILTSTLLPKRYAKQVYIGTGIYQTDIYVDFYVVGLSTMPSGLIIECKWQESEGSVDEKFPYLNLNIQYSYPAPTIIVIGGEGMREGAIDWLKERETDNHNLLAVHSLDRFIAWANQHL